MCRRCLRTVDDDALMVPDYASSIACTEDGDDASLADMIASAQNIYCASGGGLGQVSRLFKYLRIIGFLMLYVGKVTTNMLLHIF